MSLGDILPYNFGLAKLSSVLYITSSLIPYSYFEFLILLYPKNMVFL